MASIMSGFVFVGGPGLFYKIGLSSFWIVISSSFTGAMMCWVLARPLFRLTREQECLTIPDVIRARFDCRFSAAFASLGILLGVIGYLATQLQALGIILATLLGMEPQIALVLAIGVIAFYSLAGGMLASVYTDIIQGVIMVWAATLVFYYSMSGFEGTQTLLHDDSSFLSPWGTVGIFGALSWFFVFSIGSLGQPHVVNKFMMIRNLKVLKLFPLALAGSMLLCSLVWLGSGLAVKGLVLGEMIPQLRNPDETVTVFLEVIAPKWLAALTYVGIVAAIMSTTDTFANVGAAVLTRDLPRIAGYRVKKLLLWGRLSAGFLFCLALLFAFQLESLVAYLGIFAFGSFAAVLTPSLAIGLNWDKAGVWPARVSMSVGLVSVICFELMNHWGLYNWLISPAALSLTLSLLSFLIVGALTNPVRR
jgi:Na+/proline symporter